MRHSAVEQGIKSHIAAYGPTPVGRQLHGQVDDGGMLFSNMRMQVGIVGHDDVEVLEHDQPYFDQSAGRSGDGTAIARFLEIQHFKAMTRAAGFGSELGDQDEDMGDGS